MVTPFCVHLALGGMFGGPEIKEEKRLFAYFVVNTGSFTKEEKSTAAENFEITIGKFAVRFAQRGRRFVSTAGT